MEHCHSCGTRLVTSVLPEHTETFGSLTVVLRNAVLLHRCAECGEEMTEIPEPQKLYQAAALARVMLPVQLSAKDIRFLRTVFDMTQTQFAEAIGFDSAETISRWENGVRGTGGYAEKLLRFAVHARLHKAVPAADYDPDDIARMQIRQFRESEALPTLVVTRVIVKHDHQREASWDAEPQSIAA
jgi:putative zinc finger/helix-turn-helix YgiT family protein